MKTNSFLHPVNQISFGTYKPEDVKPALEITEEFAREATEAFLNLKPERRNYQNTVEAFLRSTDEFDFICHIVGHLAHTLGGQWQPQEDLMSAAAAAFYAERSLDERIYNAVKEVQNRQDKLGLNQPQRRLLDDIVIGFERSGIALPQAQKTRLKKLRQELSELETKFGQNALAATDSAHIIIKKKQELEGLDEELISQWQTAAKEKGLKGYYIQYSAPVYDRIMTLCDVKSTRQAMHKVSRSRAPQNEPVARRILAIRNEIAAILGYKNYADYTTEHRMIKNSQNARKFIDSLTASYKQPMQREGQELRDFIRQVTGDKTYQLDYTDVDGGVSLYWASKMRSAKIDLNESELRQYFPLQSVMEGMFQVLNILYGITVKPSKAAAYHPDVTPYDVYDEHGRHLSTVWCDLLARQGKRSGAWEHTVYIPDRSSGKLEEPLLAFVCANFPRPTKNKPSLLDLRDVETLWHEFGHFLHCTFGKTELREHNGYESKWDFIEAPSQIMENWVWQPEVLSRFARHYKTGQPLPEATLKKLQAARSFRAASVAMWTLYWSAADLALHIDYDPASQQPITEVTLDIKNRFFAAPMAAYDIGICSFTHIFAGGYAGGYYGYKWAEAIESDLFSRFKKEGVLNPATGRAYRDIILSQGDEKDPEVLVREFLGRDSSPDAMLERDGIKTSAGTMLI